MSGKSGVELNSEQYYKRLGRLVQAWKEDRNGGESLWKGADAVTIISGKHSEELMYKKSSTLTMWIWGVEVPNVIFVLTESKVFIVTTAVKVKLFSDLVVPADASSWNVPVPEVEYVTFTKDKGEENFAPLVEAIKGSFDGKKLGVLQKESEKEGGLAATLWKKVLADQLADLVRVSAVTGLGALFAVKERQDLGKVKTAASITTQLYKKFLLPDVETAIDEEKKVTHSTLAEKAEDIIFTPEKINHKLSSADVDSCYMPIIQSGPYDLRPSAQSDDKQLKFGTILVSLGVRYKSFCANMCRTLFVNPSPEQKQAYTAALDLHAFLLKQLKPGAVLGDVHAKVKAKAADLGVGDNFYPALGFGMGIEFRESYLVVNANSTRTLEAGMILNLDVGLTGLPTPAKQQVHGDTYAIKISDTVMINADGATALTTSPIDYGNVAYTLDDDDDDEKEEEGAGSDAVVVKSERRERPLKSESRGRRGAAADEDFPEVEDDGKGGIRVTRHSRRRAQQVDVAKESEAAKRRDHQKELWEQMKADALEKLEESGGKKEEGGKKGDRERLAISYDSRTSFPHNVPRNRIHVDHKNDTLLLPVYGDLVPFHISIVRGCSRVQADDQHELRINFVSPSGGPGGQSITSTPALATNPHSVFVREVTYRLGSERQLTTVMRQIKELRKRWQQSKAMKEKIEGIVQQDALVLSSSRNNPKLYNLLIRPNVGGRRATGTLEAHKNGFRFIGGKGQHVDIMYNNIRHAIFQPAKNTLITVIHFHLRNAIMIGRKRTMDVQVYVEVVEAIRDIEKERRSAWDQDEMDEEQREREHRRKWNDMFRKFVGHCEQVIGLDTLEFDSPYPELGFFGVAERNNVKLYPTVNCLIHILDPPFFVLTLEDVEVTVFERVNYGLKNFDMTFVFKNWTITPKRIDSVPMESLDKIEEWLDSCDMKYYKSKANLNWKSLMKMATADPEEFWEQGAWEGMFGSSEEEEDAGEDSEDDSDAFVPPDDSAPSSSEGSDYGEEEEEDVLDSDVVSDDESGMDWSELEEEAEREDRKRNFDGDQGSRKRSRDDSDSDGPNDRYKRKRKR